MGPEAGKAKNILFIPGPDREKHRPHFKILALKYCKVHRQLSIKSHQCGPVNPVKISSPDVTRISSLAFNFRDLSISWFRDSSFIYSSTLRLLDFLTMPLNPQKKRRRVLDREPKELMGEETEKPKNITSGEFSGEPEDAICPICIHPSPPEQVFKNSKQLGIWKCPDCEIMYASPRFSEASLLQIYENEAFVDQSFYEDWSYERWKRENKDRTYISQKLQIELIRRFLSKEDRILDAGSGTGLFVWKPRDRV